MKWIYILKSNDFYYVGHTSSLRRFWEHANVEEVVAIYKANSICNFIDYDNYVNTTDTYNFSKLRNFNVSECDTTTIPERLLDKLNGGNEYSEIPLCKCGLPCDIIHPYMDYLYFRCAKKNMRYGFKPCNFYMEYIKDRPLKSQIKE
jgi:hypothetical protein